MKEPKTNDEQEPQNVSDEYENNIDTEKLMESVVRVTLAGLGGSFVGLSQERKLESMRVVTGAAATAAARRKRSPLAQLSNLPLTWAISCMAFCSIIETSRLTSPTSLIIQQFGFPVVVDNSLITITDYTIGGAFAGIAGSFGRKTHLRKRLPSAMFRGSQRFFGLVPGIALGIVAGCLQATTDFGVAYFEGLSESK